MMHRPEHRLRRDRHRANLVPLPACVPFVAALLALLLASAPLALATEVGVIDPPEGLLEQLAAGGLDAGRFPDDGAARILVIFNAEKNFALARDHPGPVLWWAATPEEALFLAGADLPDQSWRLAAFADPRLLARLFPGREPILLPWRTDAERDFGRFLQQLRPERIETLSWDELRATAAERALSPVIVLREPAAADHRFLEQARLPVWNTFEAWDPDTIYDGHLHFGEDFQARNLLRAVAEIRAGNATPADITFLEPRPELVVESLRAKNARLNLGLFDDLSAVFHDEAGFVAAAETFLDNYKEAIRTRDLDAYRDLWIPDAPGLDRAVRVLQNLFNVSTSSVPHSGQPRLIRFLDDPDTVRYRVQWWFVVVDRQSGETEAVPEATFEFTLRWDGEAMRLAEVSRR